MYFCSGSETCAHATVEKAIVIIERRIIAKDFSAQLKRTNSDKKTLETADSTNAR